MDRNSAVDFSVEYWSSRNPFRSGRRSERCLNGGEAIIDLAERSVSSGADKCSIIQIRDDLNAVQIFVECNTPPSNETIILRKLDNKAVLLQKTRNGNFSDPGERLSDCGPAAQAMYVEKKGKK